MNTSLGRLMVTGGAGFIGSNIVDAALAAGYEVAVLDNFTTGYRENVNKGARLYTVDITTADEVEKAFAEFKPDYLIHHAAQIDVRRSVQYPLQDAFINICGTLNLLEAARKSQVKKVVYASSAALYGDPQYLPVDEAHPVQPLAPYGASKHTVEHYLEIFRALHGLSYVALRYSNVYGPRHDPKGEGGVVAIFTDRILAGLDITIFGDGEQTRDFVFVGDVARANLAALKADFSGIVNVSTQREISVNGLVDLMIAVSGVQVKCNRAPQREGEILRSSLANAKAKEAIAWQPQVELEEGLRLTFVAQAKAALKAGA